MKTNRTISVILALLMLTGIVSCGDANTPDAKDTQSNSSSETTAETTVDLTLPPELPDKKYDGYEFNILTRVEGWGIYNNEHLVVEEENGEVLNDAIFNRDRHVEDRFDIKLVETVTTGNISSEITQSVMAGDNSYDLVITTYGLNLGTEYLLDWNTLQYVNLDRPWWDQNFVEAASVNGKLCSTVGNIMITHMDSVLTMFYNQKLADEYKLPDLYELVRSGSWTLPKYFEITKNVTTDLNGDTKFDDNDRYAFVGLDGISRLASGVKCEYVKKDSKDLPMTNFGDQHLIDTETKLRDYAALYAADIYDPRTDSNTGGDGDRAVFRLFLNDQALFYVHGLGSAQMYRDMKCDFGVIPTPKLDDTQESYFIQPDITKQMVIPSTAPDNERTSIIVEALAYEGYSYLRPLYYETMLQNKYLRDEESIEMLDEYIYTNIGFSPSTGSSTLSSVTKSLVTGDAEIASTLAANKSAIEEEIAQYIELFN